MSAAAWAVFRRTGLSREEAERLHAAGIGEYEFEARLLGTRPRSAPWDEREALISELRAGAPRAEDLPPTSECRAVSYYAVADSAPLAGGPTRSVRDARGKTAAPSPEIAALNTRLDACANRLTLAVPDIAELAGLSPPIVSYWRKRPASGRRPFPEPVTGGRSPLFNAREVIDWLEDSHQACHATPDWYWRQAVRLLPGAVPKEQRRRLRPFVSALVTVAATLHGRIPTAATLALPGENPLTLMDFRSRARSLASSDPLIAEIVGSTLDDVEPDQITFEALALAVNLALQDRYGIVPAEVLEGALKTLAESSRDVPSSALDLAELLERLIVSPRGIAMLDPACGEAEVLLGAALKTRGRGKFVGIDRDEDALRTARARMWLRGIAADLRHGDLLQDDSVDDDRFNAVLIDAQDRSRDASIGAWARLALRKLGDGGTAIIVAPAAIASKPGTTREFPLREFIERGELEAVVFLPARSNRQADAPVLYAFSHGQLDRQILVLDLRGTRPGLTLNDLLEDNPDAIDAAIKSLYAHHRVARPDETPPTLPSSVPACLVDRARALHDGISPPTPAGLPTDLVHEIDKLAELLREHEATPGVGDAIAALKRIHSDSASDHAASSPAARPGHQDSA